MYVTLLPIQIKNPIIGHVNDCVNFKKYSLGRCGTASGCENGFVKYWSIRMYTTSFDDFKTKDLSSL